MVELELHAPRSSIGAILPEILKGMSPPSTYSLEEDGARLPIADEDGVGKLLNGSGIYLWSEDCMYELSIVDRRVVLFAMSERADVIQHTISKLSSIELLFAYACASEERAHRNRISRKMEYGVHEAWVGRDFSKYLPGLYWITVIPVITQQRLGVPVEDIKVIAREFYLVENRNWFATLYDEPGEWVRESRKVDSWCESAPGVFQKSLASKALEGAKNFIEASDVIAEWA